MFALALAAALAAPPDTTATAAPRERRVAHILEEFIVRARLDDIGSARSVQVLTPAALAALPVESLEQAVALRAGVVAQDGELHVRGGRAGDLELVVAGVPLAEPLRGKPFELPLLAVAQAELVSGGLTGRDGGALAGVLDVRTVDPPARPEGAFTWQTSGVGAHRSDRLAARAGAPLPFARAVGVVASAEVTLDDTHLPSPRTPDDARVLGIPAGWRADNRLLAHVKLAPVRGGGGPMLEVFFDRGVQAPYDPAWSLDGYATPCADPETCGTGPGFSAVPRPGHARWVAADHVATTDVRRGAAILSWARTGARARTAAAVAFLRQDARVAVGGRVRPVSEVAANLPDYGVADSPTSDPFHVYAGDWPLQHESRGDRLFARVDVARAIGRGREWRAGLGGTYDAVRLAELDGAQFGRGLDSLRAFEAFAPGAFAYAGGRLVHDDPVLHADLRAELFTAGPQARAQSLPGDGRARVTLLPRLGLAFPLGARSALSFGYMRIEQNPGREFLYENRRRIHARRPLGNPALEPAGVISYQAAFKRLFGERTYAQAALFYRDLFGQVGARNHDAPGAELVRAYASADNGHAAGFELSLSRESASGARVEAHYTWMNARGTQSLEEGDPYGVQRGERPVPIEATPLHWDRRHTIAFAVSRPMRGHWSWSWSTRLGSGLPWTPRARRALDASLADVNRERFPWSEWTDVTVRWSPPVFARWIELGLDVRNLFDERIDARATVDGYPNGAINTVYDDYGAYRTETGRGGGAYWNDLDGDGLPGWVPVGDPRLLLPGRTVRLRLGARW
jgi:outer membrane receptor protein involved in Fe transport